MYLFASLTLVAVACNENSKGENELSNGVEPVISTDKAGEVGEVDKEMIAFFEKYLPPISGSFSSECFFVEDRENRCLMINSVDELKAIMYSPVELPEIDFGKYTLVMGQYWVSSGGFKLVSQGIEIKSGEIILNLVTDYEFDVVDAMISRLYYWGIYPKLPQNSITITVHETYRGEKT
jgi:hypothetical protein